MCRSCGAIVGAGEPQCAVCGAPTANQPAATQTTRPPDRETIRFARAVLDRPYKFTIILLIANFFVFLLMWESSGMNSQSIWQGFPQPVLATSEARPPVLPDRRREVARSFVDWSLGAQEPLWGRLAGIACPVLWCVGERDGKFRALAERAARADG